MPDWSEGAGAALAEKLVQTFKMRGLKLATAESCTGGLIAKLVTDIPGASSVFDAGYVTYSNTAKTSLLAVPKTMIDAYGAVSPEVAAAMAEGARDVSGADFAVSCTGIAGPDGGTAQKPVGLAYIAVAGKTIATGIHKEIFSGDRADVRLQTAHEALRHLLTAAGDA